MRSRNTHRILSLALVGFHLQLQLVHKILKSDEIFLVLLSLAEIRNIIVVKEYNHYKSTVIVTL